MCSQSVQSTQYSFPHTGSSYVLCAPSQAEVARVRAERVRDAEVMGASMAELQHKMTLSQEFLDQRDSLEGELAEAKAQLDKQLWDHKAHVRWDSSWL